MCDFADLNYKKRAFQRAGAVPVNGAGVNWKLGWLAQAPHRASRITLLLHILAGLLLLSSSPAAVAAVPPVTFDGLVSTLNTGGITLYDPPATAIDAAGNVYISNYGIDQIIKITPQGVASTLTISGLSPGLSGPWGLAIGPAGDLYIADYLNKRVVKVTPSGAGSVVNLGSITLAGPTGVAVDHSGNLFIGDATGNQIVEVPASGTPTVLNITGLGAALGYPVGVAVDPTGNLYIADCENQRIAEVAAGTTAGTILSITGLTTPIACTQAVAADGLGNVYIADYDNERVVQVSPSGAGSVVNTGALTLSHPYGVTVDVAGNLYIADPFNARIVMVATTSAEYGHVQFGTTAGVTQTLPFTVAGATTIGSVAALTMGAANLDFTVASGTTCTNGTTGTTCNVNVQFLPTAAGLRRGALVLYDTLSNPLLTVPLYGFADAPLAALAPNTASVIGTGSGASLSYPVQVALDGAGNIYVANSSANNVIKIPQGGGNATVVSTGADTLNDPMGVAVDGAGNLFIADEGNQRIVVVTPAGTASALSISGLSTALGAPWELNFDAAGNLYIADYSNSRIVRVSSLAVTGSTSSGVGTVVGTGRIVLGVGSVTGVAVDPAGNVYVADSANNRLVEATPSGAASQLVLSGITPGLSIPYGLGVDAMGNVYIADSANSRVVELTSAGVASVLGTPGLPSPSSLSNLYGIAVDASGNVYIPDSANNRIVEVPIAGASLAFASTSYGMASSDSPKTATVTNLGNLSLVFGANPNPTYTSSFSENSLDTNLCAAGASLAAGMSCDVSVDFAPQSAGGLTAGITVADNALNTSSTQQVSVSGTANKAASAISLTPSANPSPVGGLLTFQATVSSSAGTPTGSVGFFDGTKQLCFHRSHGGGRKLRLLHAYVGFTFGHGGLQRRRKFPWHYQFAVPEQIVPTTPTINWSPPLGIIYGTTLAGILNATASSGNAPVAGSFAYTVTPSGGIASPATSTMVLSVGAYTLTATFTPTDTTNYSSVGASVSLTVSKGTTTISLASSLNPVLLKNSFTLTATLSSSASTPTGTVSFYDGGTLLGSTETLVQGSATYTTSTLAAGTHSITVFYSGDANFSSQTSPVFAQTVEDFNFGLTTTQGISTPVLYPGQTATYTFQIEPAAGVSFPSAVTLAVTGLPPGAAATFTPKSFSAGAAGANITLAVQLANQLSAHNPAAPLGGGLALAMMGGFVLLPFGSRMRRRAGGGGRVVGLTLLLLAASCAALGLSACGGGGNGFFGQQVQNYTLTVTATSGALSHSATVNLTVQ